MNGNFTDTNDDVSSRAATVSGNVLSISRGTSFDGKSGVGGSAKVTLTNQDNRFTPGNTSSPLSGLVRDGVPIRIAATYNSVSYPLFEGVVTDIVPNDTYPLEVELACVDPMGRWADSAMALVLDESRSIWEFREDLLLQFGLSGSNYSLSQSGPEAVKVPTGADSDKLLDILADLNDATRTADFIRPLAAGYQYVTKDRATLIGQAAAASYAADQIESFDGWKATSDERVNYQLVQAEPFMPAEDEEELWSWPRQFTMSPGGSRVRIAKWSDPLIMGGGRMPAQTTRYVLDATDTVTVVVTYYSTSARVAFSGGASGGQMRSFKIYGYPAEQVSLGYEESDLSAGDPRGKWAGGEISSRFLPGDAEAKGLADYLTFIGSQTLLARPTITLKRNLFPDLLQREPAERITVANGRLGLTGQSVLIESTNLTMDAGGDWRLKMQTRLHPSLSLFTVGGSAAQGVGGTGILGY